MVLSSLIIVIFGQGYLLTKLHVAFCFKRPKVSIIGSREQLCINNDVIKQETNSAKVRVFDHNCLLVITCCVIFFLQTL